MRPLFQSKVTTVELAGIEFQLKRIADALESLLAKPQIVPDVDFDPDEYSAVVYSNEEEELVQQHFNKRVGGVVVDNPGLY